MTLEEEELALDGLRILKLWLREIILDEEIFALTAEFASKMFEALVDAGFSKEEAVQLLSRMNPFGGMK